MKTAHAELDQRVKDATVALFAAQRKLQNADIEMVHATDAKVHTILASKSSYDETLALLETLFRSIPKGSLAKKQTQELIHKIESGKIILK